MESQHISFFGTISKQSAIQVASKEKSIKAVLQGESHPVSMLTFDLDLLAATVCFKLWEASGLAKQINVIVHA